MKEVRIARIVNTFGVRGQIKVISETDFEEERFKVGQKVSVVKDDQLLDEVTIASSQLHKGTYIMGFEEYHNINQIEHFKGGWLMIDGKEQQALPEDEFYQHQIVGLNVVTTEGKDLGTIKEILSLGSNDVWVVKRCEAKKKDALIPYIEDVVKEVDLTKGEVLVELMEGLIDDED